MLLVLVVDDEKDIEPLFLQRFRKEVKQELIRFDFAFSAHEALDRLKSVAATDYVLILSDINMPGMTGLDLLKEIKETHPALPVFMVTAYGDDANYQTAMKYGADGFLTKPVDFKLLKKTIFEP